MTTLNVENMLPPPVPTSDVALRSRVILEAGDLQQLTFVREHDCRSSLAQGLSDYLETLSIDWAGGRNLRFIEVKTSWAAPEDPAKYPSATLVAAMDAEYESAQFTPTTEQIDDGTGRYLRFASEMKQLFSLVIWTTDRSEREGLTAMVEDAMEPAEFMTGLRLELPYHFNVRATYEKLSMTYGDTGPDAQRRWRRTILNIVGNIPQAVPVGDLPPMTTQPRITVTDGSAC